MPLNGFEEDFNAVIGTSSVNDVVKSFFMKKTRNNLTQNERARVVCIAGTDSSLVYKMYFPNYFVNRPMKLESFTSHLQHSRPCCIRYTTRLRLGLYIRYNTVDNFVNST